MPRKTAPRGTATQLDDISTILEATLSAATPAEAGRPPRPLPDEDNPGHRDPEPRGPDEEEEDVPLPDRYTPDEDEDEDRPPLDAPDRDIVPPAKPATAMQAPRPGAASPSPGQPIRYESRIRVLEAYRYPGSLKDAPPWVDRNWIGYADADDVERGIAAGPCLRVPHSDDVLICRIGDYVARQEVLMAPGVPGVVRIEVWPSNEFEKLFVPVAPGVSAAA
jgi:hypothetical protein